MSDLRAMLTDAVIIGAIAGFGTLSALYAKEQRLPSYGELYGAGLAFSVAALGALGMMRRVVTTVRAQMARRKAA